MDRVEDQGWIPCREKLPVECQEVLVTIRWNNGEVFTKTAWLQNGEWVIKKSPFEPVVTAWQPLPEPYPG